MPTCSFNQTELYYEDQGTGGTPLVLLHGLGSSAQDWERQLPAFSRHRRVIAPDLRGFGRSSRLHRIVGPVDYANDLNHLLDALSLDRIDLLGYSLGGAIAFQFALVAPDRLRRLIILNSTPDFSVTGIRRVLEFRLRQIIIRLFGPTVLANLVGKRLFPHPDQAELRKVFCERYRHNHVPSYLFALRGLAGWNIAEQINTITAPTLVVAGEQDYTPVAEKAAYVAKMPSARFVTIPNSRHGTPFDASEPLRQAVEAFLTESST